MKVFFSLSSYSCSPKHLSGKLFYCFFKFSPRHRRFIPHILFPVIHPNIQETPFSANSSSPLATSVIRFSAFPAASEPNSSVSRTLNAFSLRLTICEYSSFFKLIPPILIPVHQQIPFLLHGWRFPPHLICS